MKDKVSNQVTLSKNAHEKLKKLIKQVERGEAHRLVLNLHAPTGFGKSATLLNFWSTYGEKFPAAHVAIGSYVGEESFNMSALLKEIIADLEQRLPQHLLGNNDDCDAERTEELVERIRDLVEKAKVYGKPVLLFFDDYDYMPEEARLELERSLLVPLTFTRQVILVLVSKTELKFLDSFELRTRRQNHRLESWDPEEIGYVFPTYRNLTSQIYVRTGGLPTAVKLFVEALSAQEVQEAESFEQQRNAIMQKYYEGIEKEFLSDKDPVMQRTILALALLRCFDTNVMGAVLRAVDKQRYQHYDMFDYLDLIADLGQWIELQSDGYALYPEHQCVLRSYIHFTLEDLSEVVHIAAVSFYKERLKERYRARYVRELLYHRLCQELHKLESWVGEHREVPRVEVKDLLKGTNGHTMQHITEEEATELHREILIDDKDLKQHLTDEQLQTLVLNLIRQLHHPPSWLHTWQTENKLSPTPN
jgi:hypothetical protein